MKVEGQNWIEWIGSKAENWSSEAVYKLLCASDLGPAGPHLPPVVSLDIRFRPRGGDLDKGLLGWGWGSSEVIGSS